MIRMPLEDMLGELGYTVAAEAAGIEEALEATKNADFDLAILPISTASPPCRLPKPWLPAARPSSLPRAMARCPSPIGGRPFHMDGLKQMLQGALG
jgi:CheY-like chemotaxis protein